MSYVPPTGEIELKFGDAYTPPTGEIELNFYVSVGVSVRGVTSQEHNPVGNLSRLVTPISGVSRQEHNPIGLLQWHAQFAKGIASQEHQPVGKLGFSLNAVKGVTAQEHNPVGKLGFSASAITGVSTQQHNPIGFLRWHAQFAKGVTSQEHNPIGLIGLALNRVSGTSSQEHNPIGKLGFSLRGIQGFSSQEHNPLGYLSLWAIRAISSQEHYAVGKLSRASGSVQGVASQEHNPIGLLRQNRMVGITSQEHNPVGFLRYTVTPILGVTNQEHTAIGKLYFKVSRVQGISAQEHNPVGKLSLDHLPYFATTPPRVATYPYPYRYVPEPIDREGIATVIPIILPTWLTFSNGVLTGVPPDPFHAESSYLVMLYVIDSNGYHTVQDWRIKVLSIYENPLPNDSLLNWLRAPSKGKVVTVHMRGYNLITNAVQDFYYATEPFISKPTDTPANRPFLEYILDVPIIESSCSVDFAGSDATWGNISLFIGALSRANLIGGYAFDLRDLIIKIGNKDWAYNQFYTLFAGCVGAAGLSVDGTSIHIPLRNNAALLNKKLLDASKPSMIYPEFLEDGITAHPAAKQLKQEVWGGTHLHPVFNVKATLVNPGEMQYQVHNGKIAEIVEVRDKGVPVLFEADLETGTFKLTQGGAQEIRCDVVGGMFQTLGNWSQPNTAADIVHMLAIRAGITPEQILESSFSQLNGSDSSVIGVVIADETTVTDLTKRILSSVNAIHEFDPDGKLIVRKLVAPPAAYEINGVYKPLYTLSDSDLDPNGVEIEQLLPPVKSTTLRYQKNWGEQTQFADSIVEEHPDLQQLYKLSFSDVVSLNSTNPDIAAFLSAEAADKVETYLTRKSDAQYYCDIRMGLRAYPRYLVKAKVLSDIGTALRNGDHVAFATENNDYGVNNKRWVIVRVAPSPLAGETNIQALEMQSE